MVPRLLPSVRSQRLLALSNFGFTVGSGMYLTAGELYFTEAVRLPAAQVGVGLGVAGALALGVAVGHLADRHDARAVYAATRVVQAAATAGFLLVHGFWAFVVAVSVATAAKAAGVAVRAAYQRANAGSRTTPPASMPLILTEPDAAPRPSLEARCTAASVPRLR